MDIALAVRTQLAASTGVIALVGARIYPLRLPLGGALPAITYATISSPRFYKHDGALGMAQSRVQVTCWASKDAQGNYLYSSAKAIATQVRLALSGYSGLMGTVLVGTCFVLNELDLVDQQTGQYYTALDFGIGHNED